MKYGKKKNYSLWWFLFLLFNLLIIAGIAYREFHGNHQSEVFSLGEGGFFYLLLALLCVVSILASETAKVFLTLRFLREPATWKDSFETVVLGRYYDALLPTGGGGQPFQIYWLKRRGYSAQAASAVPTAYFITRQVASIFLTLLTFFLVRDPESDVIRVASYLGLLFCAIIPCTEIAFSLRPSATEKTAVWLLKLGVRFRLIKDYKTALSRIISHLRQFHDGILLILREKILLAVLLLLSLLCRIALCSLPYCVLRAFNTPVSYFQTLFMTIYIYSAVTLIPTPGNSGVSEGTFYMIFSDDGAAEVFWAMLVWRIFCYYSFLLLGIIIFGRQTLSRSENIVSGSGKES